MKPDPDRVDAVPATMLCGGCAFWKKGCRNEAARCCPEQRQDRRLVIFKKDTP